MTQPQLGLDLATPSTPISAEEEARLQVRMFVSGRLRARTFRAWLEASEARLAEVPDGHEIHHIIRALRPELTRRRAPRRGAIADRLRQSGLWDRAVALERRV